MGGPQETGGSDQTEGFPPTGQRSVTAEETIGEFRRESTQVQRGVP